jgi:hypothetical protein
VGRPPLLLRCLLLPLIACHRHLLCVRFLHVDFCSTACNLWHSVLLSTFVLDSSIFLSVAKLSSEKGKNVDLQSKIDAEHDMGMNLYLV